MQTIIWGRTAQAEEAIVMLDEAEAVHVLAIEEIKAAKKALKAVIKTEENLRLGKTRETK